MAEAEINIIKGEVELFDSIFHVWDDSTTNRRVFASAELTSTTVGQPNSLENQKLYSRSDFFLT